MIDILFIQMPLEQNLLIDLEGEDFCTTSEIIRIVLLIILQENHNWSAKKRKKKPNRQSSQGIIMNNHLFVCKSVDKKEGEGMFLIISNAKSQNTQFYST